jgi:hypothetical protein
VADRNGVYARKRSFLRRFGRAKEPLDSQPTCSFCNCENASHTPQPTVERELTDGSGTFERARRKLLRGAKHRERNRQVESRPFLPQLGGREVDGYSPGREAQLGRGYPAAHAFPRLLARAVGEADDREAGDAIADVRLDVDAPRLEADESMRERAGEHALTL